MIYVLSNSFDPFYNLATEEYLLKHKTDDVIMLWRSKSAVIVGKHQNALAEVNYKYTRKNNVTVARRLSGGGTVVHDLQNLNFSFMANGEEGKLIDFKRFLQPIIEYLATLGIYAHIGKTNDLRIGDLKISGNAEHVFRKRVLHHGTLLFNSDLNQLRIAIDVTPGKYFDKAVQSNRASVTNISSHLKRDLDIGRFTSDLLSFLQNKYPGALYEFHNSEIESIIDLKNSKYIKDEWIWGYSPKYTFKNSFTFKKDLWDIEFKVEKGLIQEASIAINEEIQFDFQHAIINEYHLHKPLVEKVIRYSHVYTRLEIDKLVSLFF